MEDVSSGTRLVIELVRGIELAVSLAVAVLLGSRWLRHRSSATAAAFGVFAVLALVLAAAYVEPSDTSRGAGAAYTELLVIVLLALPTLLVAFARALGSVSVRTARLCALAYAAQVVVTVALPPLPDADDTSPAPGWVTAYTFAVIGAWAVQSVVAAAGLWRAGRAQSSVVRHRMRSLSGGAVALAVALIASGAAGSQQSDGVQLAVLFAGLGSILLFALAFLLPASLRLVWRQSDLTALSEAERGLMTALTPQDVASTIVPVLSTVFGGTAALLDRDGVPLWRDRGQTPELRELAGLVTGRDARGPAVQSVAPGVLAARLDGGWLVVQAGQLSPVFGDDEAVLLARVGTLVDLALQRVRLFEREKSSRLAAEAATAELETLLYSVSHDLRSPLISVLGYLDVLRAEHASQLQGDGEHYLERMSVNALYMQSLISDLLELSRIGRTDPPASVVDLQATAEQVVDGARLAHPAATVRVRGPLPRVRMSDVRARQLLTNLVDNALKHGGRDDLTVTVGSERTDAHLVLTVADDGRGIPAEYRSRVLRVFERLDAPKSSPGTGMGLAIVKRIAESVGGSVEIDGPPPGADSGTTVRLLLPATVLVAPSLPLPDQRAAEPVPLVEESA